MSRFIKFISEKEDVVVIDRAQIYLTTNRKYKNYYATSAANENLIWRLSKEEYHRLEKILLEEV